MQPKSNYVATGLYVYDQQILELAKNLKPSARGDLEITDIHRLYMEKGQLNVEIMGRGYAWLDIGTHDSLQFLKKSFKLACPEEIAFRQKWIDSAQVERLTEPMIKNGYGQYLLQLLKERLI